MSVYFAQAATGGPVKIGCSQDPVERVRRLSADFRGDVRLLATDVGGTSREAVYHQRFSHVRVPQQSACPGATEWFAPTFALASVVAALGGKVVGPLVEDVTGAPKQYVSDAAEALRLLLAERDTTATDLARALGLNQASVSRWISGFGRPSTLTALALEEWSGGRITRESWRTIGSLVVFKPLPRPKGRAEDRRRHAASVTSAEAA